VVVEGVAEALAARITQAIAVPTIGIGASAGCDGQILVNRRTCWACSTGRPSIVRRYADLRGDIARAVRAYADDVRDRRLFPRRPRPYFSAVKS